MIELPVFKRIEMFRDVVKCDHCVRTEVTTKILRDDAFDVPQPGYIGERYSEHTKRVLIIGINPANGFRANLSPAQCWVYPVEQVIQTAARGHGLV